MEREEEETVVKRRCVNPSSSDAFEEFSPVGDSGSFGDFGGDLLGDPCGYSECVPAVSSGLPVVTHLHRWLCLVKLCCRAPVVMLWHRSPFSLS